MEALFIALIHQLDKFQSPGIVEAEGLGQLPGGIFVAGAEAPVVQLVGQYQIERLDIRTVPEKFPDLLQMDAPLHVEHQHAQLLRHRFRRRDQIVGLRPEKLRDLGHDRLLALGIQQCAQGVSLSKGKSVHESSPSFLTSIFAGRWTG